jgi:hypothetical protein
LSDTPENDEKRPKRRRWPRILVAFIVLFVAAVLWVSGPGLRWYGPRLAQRFLEKSGLDSEFELEGNLARGLSISGFSLKSDGVIERLTVDRVTPQYSLRRLLRGEIEGLKLEGVHAELRLDPRDDEIEDDGAPTDFEALAKTLRDARERAIPIDMEVEGLTLNVTRDGSPVIALGPSSLRHEAGTDVFGVSLGVLTDGLDRKWDAQSSSLVWENDRVRVDRLQALPGMGMRDLVVETPAAGPLRASGDLLLDKGVVRFDSSPGFEEISLELLEGEVDPIGLALPFGLTLPVSGRVTAFSAALENVQPDPSLATGTASARFAEIQWEDWIVPDAALEVEIGLAAATVSLTGEALGSHFSADARIALNRSNGTIEPIEGEGNFRVPALAPFVANLAARLEGFDLERPLPVSSAAGNFTLAFSGAEVTRAQVEAGVTPADPAEVSPIALSAIWQTGLPLEFTAKVDGAAASGSFDPETRDYAGKLDAHRPLARERGCRISGGAFPERNLEWRRQSGSRPPRRRGRHCPCRMDFAGSRPDQRPRKCHLRLAACRGREAVARQLR